MGHLFAYSLAVCMVLIPLTLLERYLLSRLTFHRLIRTVIVFSLVASLVLPLFMSVPGVISGEAMKAGTGIFTAAPAMPTIIGFDTTSADYAPLWLCVLTVVYVAGVCVFAIREFVGVISLIRIIRNCREVRRIGRWRVLTHPSAAVSPLSFWKYIVVSSYEYPRLDEAVFIHERAHLDGFHWVDLILADVVSILCWYCPAAWVMRRQLADTHEYEADRAVSSSGISVKDYQKMLIQKVAGSRLPSFACNLTYHSNISKRIKMMKQKKSNPGLRLIAVAALPVAALSAMVLSVPAVAGCLSAVSEVKVTAKSVNVQEPSSANNGILTLRLPAEGGVAAVAESSRQAPASVGNSTSQHKKDGAKQETIDTPPVYPGGINALLKEVNDNLRMPEDAVSIPDLSSKVVLHFVVTPECTVKDIQVVTHGALPSLDQAAIDAVKVLKFEKPGMQDGKPVDVSFSLPVHFKVEGAAKSDSTAVAKKK
ncbi:MAG: M56 family metallopeptidase [Bacteroides sp.]|nr:M56 family metallopeptidase [Bacteroides sp.]